MSDVVFGIVGVILIWSLGIFIMGPGIIREEIELRRGRRDRRRQHREQMEALDRARRPR